MRRPEAAAPPSSFLLRFTEVGHAAGYPTADLEERVLSLAARLGLVAPQISATPTLVELSFGVARGPAELHRSGSGRRPVDLDAIARLDDVVHDVARRPARRRATALDAARRRSPASPLRAAVVRAARRLRARRRGA